MTARALLVSFVGSAGILVGACSDTEPEPIEELQEEVGTEIMSSPWHCPVPDGVRGKTQQEIFDLDRFSRSGWRVIDGYRVPAKHPLDNSTLRAGNQIVAESRSQLYPVGTRLNTLSHQPGTNVPRSDKLSSCKMAATGNLDPRDDGDEAVCELAEASRKYQVCSTNGACFPLRFGDVDTDMTATRFPREPIALEVLDLNGDRQDDLVALHEDWSVSIAFITWESTSHRPIVTRIARYEARNQPATAPKRSFVLAAILNDGVKRVATVFDGATKISVGTFTDTAGGDPFADVAADRLKIDYRQVEVSTSGKIARIWGIDATLSPSSLKWNVYVLANMQNVPNFDAKLRDAAIVMRTHYVPPTDPLDLGKFNAFISSVLTEVTMKHRDYEQNGSADPPRARGTLTAAEVSIAVEWDIHYEEKTNRIERWEQVYVRMGRFVYLMRSEGFLATKATSSWSLAFAPSDAIRDIQTADLLLWNQSFKMLRYISGPIASLRPEEPMAVVVNPPYFGMGNPKPWFQPATDLQMRTGNTKGETKETTTMVNYGGGVHASAGGSVGGSAIVSRRVGVTVSGDFSRMYQEGTIVGTTKDTQITASEGIGGVRTHIVLAQAVCTWDYLYEFIDRNDQPTGRHWLISLPILRDDGGGTWKPLQFIQEMDIGSYNERRREHDLPPLTVPHVPYAPFTYYSDLNCGTAAPDCPFFDLNGRRIPDERVLKAGELKTVIVGPKPNPEDRDLGQYQRSISFDETTISTEGKLKGNEWTLSGRYDINYTHGFEVKLFGAGLNAQVEFSGGEHGQYGKGTTTGETSSLGFNSGYTLGGTIPPVAKPEFEYMTRPYLYLWEPPGKPGKRVPVLDWTFHIDRQRGVAGGVTVKTAWHHYKGFTDPRDGSTYCAPQISTPEGGQPETRWHRIRLRTKDTLRDVRRRPGDPARTHWLGEYVDTCPCTCEERRQPDGSYEATCVGPGGEEEEGSEECGDECGNQEILLLDEPIDEAEGGADPEPDCSLSRWLDAYDACHACERPNDFCGYTAEARCPDGTCDGARCDGNACAELEVFALECPGEVEPVPPSVLTDEEQAAVPICLRDLAGSPDGDFDLDRRKNDRDNCPYAFNHKQRDGDGDGVGDACQELDYDGDGTLDRDDNCVAVANEDQADADGDGSGDACDHSDQDGDSVPDVHDVCPLLANADQADRDGDGIGDPCDDSDDDGVFDSIDNCVDVPNADQADENGDGQGEACDTDTDTDGDGWFDAYDNCVRYVNEDQLDTDGDGVGNACELAGDFDEDGIPDDEDNCVETANFDQADLDGDGFGDACGERPDFDLDEVENADDNCPDVYNPSQTDGDGDGIGDACEEPLVGPTGPSRCDVPDEPDAGTPGIPDAGFPPDVDADVPPPPPPADVDASVPPPPPPADVDASVPPPPPPADVDAGVPPPPPPAIDAGPPEGGIPDADVPPPFDAGGDPDGGGDDRDLDGYPDAVDNCPDHYNPDQSDIDSDGLGDWCDDSDSDGFVDAYDLCWYVYDPAQIDTDYDQVGDACDNCPDAHDPSQADGDFDGLGDVCDNCPDAFDPSGVDTDGDGFGDACDTCPAVSDPTQADGDLDGVGDACDVCPGVLDVEQIDTDGDGVGDACDVCPNHHDPTQDPSVCSADLRTCPGYCTPSEIDAGTCASFRIAVDYVERVGATAQEVPDRLHVIDASGTERLFPEELPYRAPQDAEEVEFFTGMPREQFYDLFGTMLPEHLVLPEPIEVDAGTSPDAPADPTICSDETIAFEVRVFVDGTDPGPLASDCDCRRVAERVARDYAQAQALPHADESTLYSVVTQFMAPAWALAAAAPPPPAPRPTRLRQQSGHQIPMPAAPANHPVHRAYAHAVDLQHRLEHSYPNWIRATSGADRASRKRVILGLSLYAAILAGHHEDAVAIGENLLWMELFPYWSMVQGAHALNLGAHLPWKRAWLHETDVPTLAAGIGMPGAESPRGLVMGLASAPPLAQLREIYRARVKRIDLDERGDPVIEFEFVDLQGNRVMEGALPVPARRLTATEELTVTGGQGRTPALARARHRKPTMTNAQIDFLESRNLPVDVFWGSRTDADRAGYHQKTALIIGAGGTGLQLVKETSNMRDGNGTHPNVKLRVHLAVGGQWDTELDNEPAANVNPRTGEPGNLVSVREDIRTRIGLVGAVNEPTQDFVHVAPNTDGGGQRRRVGIKDGSIEIVTDETGQPVADRPIKLRLVYYNENGGVVSDLIDGPEIRVDYIIGGTGGTLLDELQVDARILRGIRVWRINGEVVGLESPAHKVKFEGLSALQALAAARRAFPTGSVERTAFEENVAEPFNRELREQGEALFPNHQDRQGPGILPLGLPRTRKAARGLDGRQSRGLHPNHPRMHREWRGDANGKANAAGEYTWTELVTFNLEGTRAITIERIRIRRSGDLADTEYYEATGDDINQEDLAASNVRLKDKAQASCGGCHVTARRPLRGGGTMWADFIFKFDPRPFPAPADYDGPYRGNDGVAALIRHYESFGLVQEGTTTKGVTTRAIDARAFRLDLSYPSHIRLPE